MSICGSGARSAHSETTHKSKRGRRRDGSHDVGHCFRLHEGLRAESGIIRACERDVSVSGTDRRASHNIALLRRKNETNDIKTNTKNALKYADDIINCSRSHRTGLERMLDKKLPRTWEIVKKILELESTRDLSKIEEVLPFSKEVVKALDLMGNWSESKDIEQMRKQVAELKSHDK